MSHFSVLVISDNLKDVLAPYAEQDEEFFTPHDTTSNYLADYEKHKKNDQTFADFIKDWCGYEVVSSAKEAEACERRHRGYALVDEKGNCVKCVGYWNDNAKWDYWTDARDSWSRWDYSNFIFKDPSFNPKENEIRIKDIDIDAMVEKALKARGEAWDAVIKDVFGGVIPTIITWESLCEDVKTKIDNLDSNLSGADHKASVDKFWAEAREKYHAQEAVKKFKELTKNFWDSVEDYCKPREEFVDEATLPFYSIVTENGWFERATMGWWGISHSETMTYAEWRKKQIELFKEVDGETIVNLVDCHI